MCHFVKRVGLTLILAVVISQSVRAGNILYYNDMTLGDDAMASALAGLSGSTVTTATDSTDFQTQLATGNFDLGIYMIQNATGYDSTFAALATFVQNGGKAIIDFNDTATGAPTGFGAAFTGNTNDSSLTVTDTTLASGLSGNSLTFANPGWANFSFGLTADPGAIVAATLSNSESAIVIANSGRSIFNGFLSDTFLNSSDNLQLWNDGVRLYTNEINSVLSASVPEPSSLALGMTGLLAVMTCNRRRVAKPNANH